MLSMIAGLCDNCVDFVVIGGVAAREGSGFGHVASNSKRGSAAAMSSPL